MLVLGVSLAHLGDDPRLEQLLVVLYPQLELLTALLLVLRLSVDLTLARPEECLEGCVWVVSILVVRSTLGDLWGRGHGIVVARISWLRLVR